MPNKLKNMYHPDDEKFMALAALCSFVIVAAVIAIVLLAFYLLTSI